MSRFHTGNTVPLDKFYIERSADKQLLHLLRGGQNCWLLGPRQVGKSSMAVRVDRLLRQKEGAQTVYLDLGGIGTRGVSSEDWYFSLLDSLAR